MSQRVTTPAERLEFLVLFTLLLPFYCWMLPARGALQTAGFAWVGLLCAYMIFVSPHRDPDPAARASLREVPAVTLWILAVLWGVLPLGWWGRRVGIAILAATVGYVLFGSPRRHRDTLADRGLGSPALTRARLTETGGRGLLALFVAINVGLVLACALAPDVVSDVMRGVLRRCLGIKTEHVLPAPLVAAIALVVVNALLWVTRWDNLRAALRVVGVYVLGLIAVVSTAGWLYIFVYSGGSVEIDPVRGLVSMTSYAFWGSLQELLFLSYYNTRIRKGISSPLLSALLTSVVFSLFHLRAYALMFLCFLVMNVWALIFQVAPNLFALGLSHGISGGFGGLFRVTGTTIIKIQGSVGPFNP